MSPLIEISGLRVEATSPTGTIMALDGVDLDIHRGDVLGVIGESGSGKTTLMKSLIGILDRNVRVTAGTITFDGEEVLSPTVNRLSGVRGSRIGMVFQSALTSLNPLLRVGTQLREVLRQHVPASGDAEHDARIRAVLAQMGFPDADRILGSYPHQLSGGMRQRAAIAIAIATKPDVVIADECTSALDVTTQAEVVALLRQSSVDMGNALLFVTHDVLLATELCTKVAVLYAGQIVEMGSLAEVLEAPRHPYTRALLASVPVWEPRRALVGIPGGPTPVRPGTVGCRFADRCPYVVDDCRTEDVTLHDPGDSHAYRCIVPHDMPVDPALMGQIR